MQSTLFNWTLNTINQQFNGFTPPLDMRETISHIKALPPLPGNALRIVELAADPLADAEKLAAIVELDPLLTMQIVRWASSPFYGNRGKINTVHDAIVRVLGFNFVLDLALGLSVLAPLKCPKDGIIGIRMFWVHALASTRLMKRLADQLPSQDGITQQELFLAGLLHNIGFPLFGHQFPEEFDHLIGLINTNPNLAIFNMENFALGVNHAEMGTWLMNAWSMPRVITNIVYHHHNPCYRGENYRLNLLTFLSDCLLGRIGIGDGVNQDCPASVFSALELDQDNCMKALEAVEEEVENIRAMADSLLS
jgi:HD-like signal output (HDOD) protein